MVAIERQIQTLREQLLPTIFRVRTSRISITLPQSRVVCFLLSILRVHASRGRVEDLSLIQFFLLIQFKLRFQDVEVDSGRVVHDLRVILSTENISSTTHISSILIDLIKWFLERLGSLMVEVTLLARETNHTFNEFLVGKVTNHELISSSFRILWSLDINTTHPISFLFQSADHVTADETTSTTYKCSLSHCRCNLR